MKKTLNFDKFLSEAKHETIDVTVYGKTYKVKAKVPAIVPLSMARAERLADQKSRNQEQVRMIMNAAEAFFGKNALDEFCAKGMTSDQLSNLVNELFLMINGNEDEDEGQELSDEDSRSILPGESEKK